MSQMMTIANDRYSLRARTIERLGVGLSLAGVLAVGLTAAFSDLSVPIERPWVLAAASGFLLLPARGERVVLLQKVVGLYLVGVLFNQVYGQFFTISIASQRIGISRSVGPFLLCALGSILLWRRPPAFVDVADRSPLLRAWLIAFAILITHMLVLAALLHAFYGYGYGADLRVLAHLALYILLFLLLSPPLHQFRFRCYTGFVVAMAYLFLTFTD